MLGKNQELKPSGALLHCAYDNCLVTAELKKSRYIYYRCTGSRGKCLLPYFREVELGERLGEILKGIHIPDAILTQLRGSLLSDKSYQDTHRKQQRERLQQRLRVVRHRVDQAYLDKLDGKITEEFWARQSAQWQQEEEQIHLAMQGLSQANPDRMVEGVKILELANKAYFLYLKQPPHRQSQIASNRNFRTAWSMPQVFIPYTESPSI